MERSIIVFTVLRLVGAAYLVYPGVRAWRERGSLRASFADGDGGGAVACARSGRGVLVGASNPKTLVFSAAVLPQFVDRGQGRVVLQMRVLGLIFNAIALASDCVRGLAAATARDWFARSPQRLSLVGGVGGIAMISLGVTVAATGRKD